MTLSPALLRFRFVAAVLLAVACLQAVPTKAVAFERRHGSAFDIAAVEVSTAPFQCKAEQGQVQRIEPPAAKAPVRPVSEHAAARTSRFLRFGRPPQTGPPRVRDVASLTHAARGPPLA